jgi:hypothetical protein
MKVEDFKDAVFYNSDDVNPVRRYYTVKELYDTNDNELNYKYRGLLCEYIKSINVYFSQGMFLGREFLPSIGVIVDNSEVVPYTLYFPKDCNVNEFESKIIEKAKEYKHIIKPITAHIDLGILMEKEVRGELVLGGRGERLLPLTEDVIKPNDISNTASFMIDNLGGLYSKGKTVIITDNYLFPKDYDNEYKTDLQATLKFLEADEIIHFGMKKTFNYQFFSDIKLYLNNYGTKLSHKHIRDFHDRFWIVKDTFDGLVFGTSLNGIGRKLCYYDAISREDAKVVLDYLNI